MKFKLLVLTALAATMCISTSAFAQIVPTPAAPASYTVPALAALLGILTNAYNTGSIFGLKTLPKPWLPYLALGVTFLGGFITSLGAQPLSGPTAYAAFLAGLGALAGLATGAAGHSVLSAHKSSRGVAATQGPGGPESTPPDSTTRVTPVEGFKPTVVK